MNIAYNDMLVKWRYDLGLKANLPSILLYKALYKDTILPNEPSSYVSSNHLSEHKNSHIGYTGRAFHQCALSYAALNYLIW